MMNRLFVLCLCCLAAPALLAADYQGSLDWSARAELGMLVSGVVGKVHVKAGQPVSKGDPLLQLDERDFTYRATSTKAVLERAKSTYEEAQREHERSVELYDRRLLSDHELQLKQIALVAAKAALESHIRQLALELAPRNIKCNAIQAGITDTPALRQIPGHETAIEIAMTCHPFGRMTVPEDVARALVSLAQSGSAWITGHVIPVDGGEDIVALALCG